MPFKKGQSGNLAGRPKTSVSDLVKLHPQRNELVQKLFDVAMNDTDKRQVSAWRILLPKMVPDLKAMQMEVEQKSVTGVIVLPQKVPLDNPKVSMNKQSESVTISVGDVGQDSAESQGKSGQKVDKSKLTEEKDTLT
jgi:hypothetical protein|tara:strand:+ start:1103 stop:1513 length:411 start_codon:yes stop_codon:yes gene_type:complete